MPACTPSYSNTFLTRFGRVCVLRHEELEDLELLKSAFAGHCKDHRFYEVLNATLNQSFDYRYLILEDETGRARAIQPFFFVDQDLMMTSRLRSGVKWFRKFFPRFLILRMLMVGSPVGEGFLGAVNADDKKWVASALHEALQHVESGAALVILKDFSPTDRPVLAPFSNDGYTRITGMPMARLPLDVESFEDYMEKRLSKVMRKNLRRKFRKEAGTLVMEVHEDVSPFIEEVYPLYLQVHDRSQLKFERLTREYLCELGRQMPDRVRFFIWRLQGRAVAFAVCMIHDNSIYDEYLGLDYSVALELHLYFCTFRDLMRWAIDRKLNYYYSSPLNYDPKLHLRFELYPLDLYVRHTWLNPIFRHLLPFVQPTRSDPVLKRFLNPEKKINLQEGTEKK